MSSGGRLTELASIIAASAQNLEHSDFSEQSANGFNGGVNTVEANRRPIHEIRIELLDACRELLNLATGPAEMLKNMALIDKHNLASLRIINRYRIATLVPLDGETSMADIATKCGLPESLITRILRQAMTYGVFRESKEGIICHTAVSREIPRLSPLLSYQLDTCLPSTLGLIDWLNPEKMKNYKCAFQIAHSTNHTWWSYAEKRPDLIQNYSKYMALITDGGPHDVSHVVNGFDWEGLGDAILVDVGGADGFVGVTLADKYPKLTVFVQDSSNLENNAGAKTPQSLKSQVYFTPHSFFQPQPATSSSADVFLLRHILHDWDDNDCFTILRHLSSCMKPGARIIVADQVFCSPGKVDQYTERIMRALDMQMMVQFGSKERTLEDWKDLFRVADPLFEIVGMVQPPGSADTLMELRKKEDGGSSTAELRSEELHENGRHSTGNGH